MRTGLYGQLQHTRAVAPDGMVDQVAEAYLEMALSGLCTPEARKLFFDAGARMIDAQKADAIVLAGTDLGLAFDGHDPGYKVVDALDVHVAVLADLASDAAGLK